MDNRRTICIDDVQPKHKDEQGRWICRWCGKPNYDRELMVLVAQMRAG